MVASQPQPVGDLPRPMPPAPPVRAASAPPPADEPPLLDLGQFLRDSPPWLISAIVHMLAVIVLGLVFLQPQLNTDLLLDLGISEDFGDPTIEELDLVSDELEIDDQQILTPENLPLVEDPLATPSVVDVAPPQPVFATGTVAPTAIGLALTGREPGMKKAMLRAGGGTGETEGAVTMGLRWLADQQQSDGSWSLSGPYSDGTGSENVESATAMALLAFQGAGYTPESDSKHPFTPVVRRGWAALLKRLDNEGKFYHDVPNNHQLYTQAQCTIALCELYAMTGDEQYRDAAQKAVDFCVSAQASTGGWKYQPGQTGDMSVTGWMVMALQSARMAGIEVPSPTWELVNQFLDSVARDNGARYAYMARDGATLALTAEGLLCRQYMGWTRDDPRLNAGVAYLLSNLPQWDKRNVYYWYYATQVCHHMEGEPWQVWNYVMRELLPAHQVRRGREKGSWDPAGDRWGSHGGRLYVTCLSIYILEVYYRHLPLYHSGLLDGTR